MLSRTPLTKKSMLRASEESRSSAGDGGSDGTEPAPQSHGAVPRRSGQRQDSLPDSKSAGERENGTREGKQAVDRSQEGRDGHWEDSSGKCERLQHGRLQQGATARKSPDWMGEDEDGDEGRPMDDYAQEEKKRIPEMISSGQKGSVSRRVPCRPISPRSKSKSASPTAGASAAERTGGALQQHEEHVLQCRDSCKMALAAAEQVQSVCVAPRMCQFDCLPGACPGT